MAKTKRDWRSTKEHDEGCCCKKCLRKEEAELRGKSGKISRNNWFMYVESDDESEI